MSYSSILYICMFLPAVTLLYGIMPQRHRWKVLLAVSYIFFYLLSTTAYEQLTKYKKATAQESISIDAIRNVLMPIPTLNEQERKVSAIDTALSIKQKL